MSLNIDDFIVENLFSRKINEFFRKNEDKSFFFVYLQMISTN